MSDTDPQLIADLARVPEPARAVANWYGHVSLGMVGNEVLALQEILALCDKAEHIDGQA